jgi:two-component system OmpR family sensor kinase
LAPAADAAKYAADLGAGPPAMTRSLSGRLLIGVIALMLAGLAISGVATYLLLQNSLLGKVDQQLVQRSTVDTATIVLSGNCGVGRTPLPADFPAGTVTELLGADGKPVISCRFLGTSSALPKLPATLPLSSTLDAPSAPFTVSGSTGGIQFRVTAWRENSFGGSPVVFAIPLTDMQSTLSQLLILEAAIGATVVIAAAVLAWFIVRIGLRPLERMGSVASEIAAGDLSRRVEPATRDTEIGRLGLALNAMLSQIESAFAERTRSENRLRRFIADASHELRTPLTSIRGYAEMLRRGAEKSPEDSTVARRRIEEESVRMSVMVDDMLVLARLGQGRPLERAPVDLQAIARDAVADARAVAPQREISLQASDPTLVAGDDTRLRQVLGNLVRNALVHTPADSPIEIGVMSENGFARMSVADHGPGLRPEDVSRVFEPFFRADPSRSRDSGGVGLGLSIVAAVAAAHGGTVRVRDTPGGGATFEVELPVQAEATAASA